MNRPIISGAAMAEGGKYIPILLGHNIETGKKGSLQMCMLVWEQTFW